MVIAPCSMKTLASIAHGLSDNLVSRAADVVLKERRRLVLMVRETPLNLAHLRNMTSVTEMGGIVYPPMPAFYARPGSLQEMVDHTVGRVLDLFDISHAGLVQRWEGACTPRLPGTAGTRRREPSEKRRARAGLRRPLGEPPTHHGAARAASGAAPHLGLELRRTWFRAKRV
jgi:hypothetical protein